METSHDNWLLYDGECPFCARFAAYTRLRETVGTLRLVNARDGGSEADEARAVLERAAGPLENAPEPDAV
ncbi:MAG: hypothetical protein AAFN05_14885, partial [Pseudomonadota bacterium]